MPRGPVPRGPVPVPLGTENPAELPPVADGPSPLPLGVPAGYGGRPVPKADGVAAVPREVSDSRDR